MTWETDPFDTASLRSALLTAWRESPTRLAEDAALERDLVTGGYRERVFTELAQNAADAVGSGGALRVWLTEGALHVANTGRPLDDAGVRALAALRVSAKTEGVGRFGVGFTSVLALSDDVELRSRNGGVRFSRALTRDLLHENGIDISLAEVPALRMPWPTAEPPSWGDTEVVLRLRGDGSGVLADIAEQAVMVLLELTALQSITVGEQRFDRAGNAIGDRRFAVVRHRDVTIAAEIVDDQIVALPGTVLRAPTPSDEPLSLPVWVIAHAAPMAPDRRRLAPDADLRALAGDIAEAYARFVIEIPAADRFAVLPRPAVARGEFDDAVLRHVAMALRSVRWVPVFGSQDAAAPERVTVVPGLTPQLAAVLRDVIADVAQADSRTHERLLRDLGARVLEPAALAEVLAPVDREPAWWAELADALSSTIEPSAISELAALPVPLITGRMALGARGALYCPEVADPDAARAVLDSLRYIDPRGWHPLWERLGATVVTVADLLSDSVIEQLVTDPDADSDVGDTELADAVLTLVAAAGPGYVAPTWLGELLVSDADGNFRPIDELLIPDAPLREVLVADAPFGVVAADLVERFGVDALRCAGAGFGFSLVRDPLPTEPDHGIADEDLWWDTLSGDPEELVAVRDLDLVAPDRWPRALEILVSQDSTRDAFADRAGYTAWWIRQHAEIQGTPIGQLRHADDTLLAGVLDACDLPFAHQLTNVLACAEITDAALASLVIARLGSADREPMPGTTFALYTAVAQAVATGRVELDDVDVPDAVRAVSGALVSPERALVLDDAQLAPLIDRARLVVVAVEQASRLATILDVPLASEVVSGTVVSRGRASMAAREPDAVLAAARIGVPLPAGAVEIHDELRIADHEGEEFTVPYWRTGGVLHVRGDWPYWGE